MLSALLLMTLAGAPRAPVVPVVLPPIEAPLGHIGNVLEPAPTGSLPEGEKPLLVTFEGCEPQVIYLARMLGGTARAVEQLDGWLARVPDVKKRLTGKKDVLADTIAQLRDADRVPNKACKPLKLKDGFKVTLDRAPSKWCADKEARSQGDFWFNTGKKPAAVVHVLPGLENACLPRLSTVLFDTRGRARLRFHADFGGQLSAELLGDGCRGVDFTFDQASQTFLATLKPCKR